MICFPAAAPPLPSPPPQHTYLSFRSSAQVDLVEEGTIQSNDSTPTRAATREGAYSSHDSNGDAPSTVHNLDILERLIGRRSEKRKPHLTASPSPRSDHIGHRGYELDSPDKVRAIGLVFRPVVVSPSPRLPISGDRLFVPASLKRDAAVLGILPCDELAFGCPLSDGELLCSLPFNRSIAVLPHGGSAPKRAPPPPPPPPHSCHISVRRWRFATSRSVTGTMAI